MNSNDGPGGQGDPDSDSAGDDDPDFGDGLEESDPEGFDPERLADCAYWRCGQLFERVTANQLYCRKACRSRQKKWERAQVRRAARAARRA